MREKEIINLRDGCRIGSVCDVEIDTCTGAVVSLIVFGKSKALGFMGKCEDIKICWKDIKVIGDDTILVDFDCPAEFKKTINNGVFESLFKHK
jgi:YlmC/YmxH family sporulation protein